MTAISEGGHADDYVRLIDEDVLVWRPVRAQPTGRNVYLIVAQPYDREVEEWEFQPGDRVVVEVVETFEGRIPAAVRRAD